MLASFLKPERSPIPSRETAPIADVSEMRNGFLQYVTEKVSPFKAVLLWPRNSWAVEMSSP